MYKFTRVGVGIKPTWIFIGQPTLDKLHFFQTGIFHEIQQISKLKPSKNWVCSGWKSVVGGCPQGSSLGPLIWNIIQNDLVYNSDANISMHADNHQIYQTGKSISTVHTKLEESASSAG